MSEQRARWEAALGERPDRYGAEESEPARAAASTFAAAGCRTLLELGAGQGRDTVFFARHGFDVTALDFAEAATATIARKAAARRLAVSVLQHDVRELLPFADASFDACYSHMLFCMALDGDELAALAREVLRVLRPGGLCVYTARTTDDPDFGQGEHHGENVYELGGFPVHFFDAETIGRLADGYESVEVEPFEEGPLPRRLVRVSMQSSEDIQISPGRESRLELG